MARGSQGDTARNGCGMKRWLVALAWTLLPNALWLIPLYVHSL